jgi:RNA 2',3'-cyclic 3'-phosphodiesterase
MRLFVAVWPPADVGASIAALARPEVDGLRWMTEDQWHVTLRFLGECDVDDAMAALSTVDAALTTAVMGPVTGRFARRVLHVPVAGLDEVAGRVITKTKRVGKPPEPRPFNGHLTLARSRERRGVDLRPLTGVPLAGEWPVDEVTLVVSQLHPKGARYEIVGRQRLT